MIFKKSFSVNDYNKQDSIVIEFINQSIAVDKNFTNGSIVQFGNYSA